MRKYILLFIVVIFITIPFALLSQEKNSDDYWDELHYALKYKVDKNFKKPDNYKAPLEEYIYWIRLKGNDLKEVKKIWQELNLLYNANPDSEIYKKWMNKFYYLNLLAEGSGTSTVNFASSIHLRHECHGYSKTIVWKIREKGRLIYQAALEEGFDTNYPSERSRCLLNCAIGLLESDGRYGFSLYKGRVMEFGFLDEEGVLNTPDYNFVIECERRGAFVRQSEGKPAKELTYAFENAGEIINECEWWGFSGERQDAEDLLVEYYKDALCKKPPHTSTMGHKFYRELAEQHKLKEAVDYNNGFYGVLYGKVEIEKEGVKKRAPGSKVVFESEDEHWETVTDEKGEYRFEKGILHKHCSPFHIYAVYKGDRVDDQFEGTLEQPNPNSTKLKNLLIISTDKYVWNGSFNIDVTKRFLCNVQEKASEIRNEEIRADDEHTQKVNVTIGMNDFDLAINPSIPGTRLIREASGEMQCVIREDHFTATRAEKTECYNESGGEGERSHIWVSPGSWSTKHETSSGQASRTIKKKNINLLIVKDIELDKEAMKNLQKQMQEAAKNKDYAAIQSLSGQMTGMVKGDKNSNVIPIRIRIEVLLDITKKDFITKTFDRKSYDVCKDSTEADNGSNNIEQSVALPMGVEMKGTYTRGEDGNDIINASVDMTENTRGNFYSGKCPDATRTISARINLERKRK